MSSLIDAPVIPCGSPKPTSVAALQRLEARFSPAFAAALALREKQIQQNYRPIIGVHKWFARRPGTVFRSLSGVIRPEELEASITPAHSVYSLDPVAPLEPSPTLISSPEALTSFDRTVRRFLVQVEKDHGKLERIDLFAAVPVSAAVTLGRVLMPDVSPAWAVFDRDEQGQFFYALEVKR